MFLCVIKLRDDFRFTNKAPLQGGERHTGHIVATDKAPLTGWGEASGTHCCSYRHFERSEKSYPSLKKTVVIPSAARKLQL